MGQVKIGREFFKNAKKDYRNANWAWVREIMQNSIDAPGCDHIKIHVEVGGQDGQGGPTITTVTVENNGKPMDQDTLIGKLLTLGESGKRFQEQDGVQKTGGFGKAKELLYFCQRSYQIISGDLHLTGEGGEYEIATTETPFDGTRSVVVMDGDMRVDLWEAFRSFCQYAQWSGSVVMNGREVATDLRKGSPRREFEWAKVYTNRSFTNVVVVRINGTPMFTRYTDFKGCVIVELTGNSGDRLSANRDSLLYSIGNELDAFLVQLTVDKRSALRQRKAEIRRFEGERLKNEAKKPKAVGSIFDVLSSDSGDESEGGELIPESLAALVLAAAQHNSGISEEVVSREDVRVTIGPEFILKQTCGMDTPDYYIPGPAFSDYSKKLAMAWARCLLELHKILDISADFSIGFCLDEDSVAESERSSVYGQVYYINPAVVVGQRDKPQCRSFKRRFTGAWQNRFEIISVAVHEIIHGAYGISVHDEEFSCKFTEVFGLVLPHMTRLSALFRG